MRWALGQLKRHSGEAGPTMSESPDLDDVRAARGELDAVIEEIRGVPGYGDFLTVPTFADVAAVADMCPLVYLVAADAGGLALIVQGTDVTHVPLEDLKAGALRARVVNHLDRYAIYRRKVHDSFQSAHAEWNAALDEVTAWLWDAVMGPVLDHIGEAADLTIVAGGLLGLLPLHAAWTVDSGRVTGRQYVIDTVSVSYAPNARSLRVARRRAREVSASRLLAVADPWPVSADPLPMAKHEAAIAAAAFPEAPKVLERDEATFLSFEWAAPRADVLHLACHGFAALIRPLDSGLALAGGSVTLGQLMEWRLRARLAVLSACETAQPGTQLPDEVVALPTGLLQAGVAGIVASQWSVPDRATAMLMAEFYRRWGSERASPAIALRGAQCWLRDTTTAEKSAHFTAALSCQANWLPTDVGEVFVDWLRFSADGLGHAGIHQWGAFAHVGA